MPRKPKSKEPPVVPVGNMEAAMKAVEEALRNRYDNFWQPEWRAAMTFQQLMDSFKPTNTEAIIASSKEQIIRVVSWGCITKVEFGLTMIPVIACREGRHPSCIDGQPYDPRYQQPNTLPLRTA